MATGFFLGVEVLLYLECWGRLFKSILIAIDNEIVISVLPCYYLIFSAAFDTVDHELLLHRIRCEPGCELNVFG